MGPASHANLSGRQSASVPPRMLQQISKPVSRPSFKERKTKEGKLVGTCRRGGGGIGSRSFIPTDIGLNHQLEVFPDKNLRTSVVVGCTKGKVLASGPGCIATPSTGNYPSTPLLAVLTICHCRGSLPLVPVYQRLLLTQLLKHRHCDCIILERRLQHG